MGALVLFILSFPVLGSLSPASVELKKEIAALTREIQESQEKINKSKPGETLEKITLSVSIRNMQRIFDSIKRKAGDAKTSAVHVNTLGSSLKAGIIWGNVVGDVLFSSFAPRSSGHQLPVETFQLISRVGGGQGEIEWHQILGSHLCLRERLL